MKIDIIDLLVGGRYLQAYNVEWMTDENLL